MTVLWLLGTAGITAGPSGAGHTDKVIRTIIRISCGCGKFCAFWMEEEIAQSDRKRKCSRRMEKRYSE